MDLNTIRILAQVVIAGQGRSYTAQIEQAEWIIRESVSTMTALTALYDLGAGEAEAICACH
jgi:hypothetical protein